jgi:predicted nuclease of predicted toxin-antitoxin system
MKLLLDNNLPPALARALHELTIREWDCAHEVIHLRDHFPANTPDTEWVTKLSQEDGWVVVTHDKFNKGVEREVLRRAGLKVFLLDGSWKHHQFWEKAIQLTRWWPRIIEQAGGIRGGAAFRVPWNFTGKGQFGQLTW